MHSVYVGAGRPLRPTCPPTQVHRLLFGSSSILDVGSGLSRAQAPLGHLGSDHLFQMEVRAACLGGG